MATPTRFSDLTKDPRYTGLAWNQKKVVLSRFSEKNPSPVLPLAGELERLRHFSEGNTPAVNKMNQDLYQARRNWANRIVEEEGKRPEEINWRERLLQGNSSEADAEFQRDQNNITEEYRASMVRRQEDLNLASSLNFLEGKLKVSASSVVMDLLDAANPVNLLTGESPRGITRSKNTEDKYEILNKLKERYSEEEIVQLQRDAQINQGQIGDVAADVDSQGNIGVNIGSLIRDPAGTSKAIEELDAPALSKSKELRSLNLKKQQAVDDIFVQWAYTGGLTWDTDDNGNKLNFRLSDATSLAQLEAVKTTGSFIASMFGASDTDLTKRDEGARLSYDKKRALKRLELELGVTYEDREKAVVDLLGRRDDVIDRISIEFSRGVADIGTMFVSAGELLGSDTATSFREESQKKEEAFASADRIIPLTKKAEFLGLFARVVPQILATRKVGNLGGSIAASARTSKATQAATATAFATGFGGLQSASFSVQDVLNNGGTTEDALAAGMLSFGTTALIANGFNKIGAGGVEDFRNKLIQSANKEARQKLIARLSAIKASGGSASGEVILKGTTRLGNTAKGLVGEGVEEFIDEYLNGIITADFTNASAEEIAENAFVGALIGGTFGAGFGAAKPTLDTITTDTSTDEVSNAADEAARSLDVPRQELLARKIQDLQSKDSTQEGGLTEKQIEELEKLEKEFFEGGASDADGDPVEAALQRGADFRREEAIERILDLKEKASYVDEVEQPDGTMVQVGGLTAQEEAELESLQRRFSDEEGFSISDEQLEKELATREGKQLASDSFETQVRRVTKDLERDLSNAADEEFRVTPVQVEVEEFLPSERPQRSTNDPSSQTASSPSKVRERVTVPEESQRSINDELAVGREVSVDGYKGTLVDDNGRLALEQDDGSIVELSDSQLAKATLKPKSPVDFEIDNQGDITLSGTSGYRYKSTNKDSVGNMQSVTVVDSSGQEVDLVGDEANAVIIDQSKNKGFFSLSREAPDPRPAPKRESNATVKLGPAVFGGLDPVVDVAEKVIEGEEVSSPDLVLARNKIRERLSEVQARVSQGSYANGAEILNKLERVHTALSEEVQRRFQEVRQRLYERLFSQDQQVENEVTEETPQLAETSPEPSPKEKVEVYEKVMEEENPDLTQDEEDALVDDYADAALEEGVIEENPTEQISEPTVRPAIRNELLAELDSARAEVETFIEDSGDIDGAIPEDLLDDTPTESTVDDLTTWVEEAQDSLEAYRDSIDADEDIARMREEQIEIAEEVVTSYRKYFNDIEADNNLSNEGDTPPSSQGSVLYGGLFFLDPALITSSIKAVFSESKNFLQFSKRMLSRFGSVVKDRLRTFWNDLKTFNEVQPSTPLSEDVDQPVEPEEDITQQRLDEALGINQEEEVSTPADKVDLPRQLSLEEETRLAVPKSGSQNSIIPGLRTILNTLSLGLTTQVHDKVLKEFYGKAYLAWLWGREAASRKAKFVADQFSRLFGDELTVDKNNRFTKVKAREEGRSLHVSDVIEDVMENGTENYIVSDKFLKFVAEWRRIRDLVLVDAENAGMNLDFLKNDQGEFDNTKILENFFFPRGRVVLQEDLGKDTPGGGSGRPRGSARSLSNRRQFDKEQDGNSPLDKDGNPKDVYVYIDSPIARIENFLNDVYSRIADTRLATNPDIVRATGRTTFTKDDKGRKRVNRSLKREPLSLAGRKYTTTPSVASELNILLEEQTLSGKGADRYLDKVSRIFQGVRAVKFTFDFSAATIQLAFLYATHPIRYGRALKVSIASTLGKKEYKDNYDKKNRDITSERVRLGSLYGTSTQDADFLRDTDRSSSGVRRLLAKVNGGFTYFHATAMEIGANEMYAAIRYRAVDPKTEKLDEEKAAKLVKFADRTSGRESLARSGLTAAHRGLLSLASSSPGMYAAYANLMLDIQSKDKFTRDNALKSHVRFVIGMGLSFVAKAFAVMSMDDEDERTDEQKFDDALSRLHPLSPKFMAIEYPIGGGRRAIVAEGGFFRSAVQTSARISADPGRAFEHAGRFLKSKKSPGVGTVLEIATKKDYFGNEITTLESLTDALLPISLNTLAQEYKGPVLDVVAQTFTDVGIPVEGQSRTRLLEERPALNQTLEQMMFSAVGFSTYTESSRAKFTRDIERIAQVDYKRKYKELSFEEKAKLLLDAESRGIVKPKINTPKSFVEFKLNSFRNRVSDPNATKVLTDLGIYQKVAVIDTYSVDGPGGAKVIIDRDDRKRIVESYDKKWINFLKTPEADQMDSDQMVEEIQKIWSNELRAAGYY